MRSVNGQLLDAAEDLTEAAKLIEKVTRTVRGVPSQMSRGPRDLHLRVKSIGETLDTAKGDIGHAQEVMAALVGVMTVDEYINRPRFAPPTRND